MRWFSCHIHVTCWEGLTPQQICSLYILQPQHTKVILLSSQYPTLIVNAMKKKVLAIFFFCAQLVFYHKLTNRLTFKNSELSPETLSRTHCEISRKWPLLCRSHSWLVWGSLVKKGWLCEEKLHSTKPPAFGLLTTHTQTRCVCVCGILANMLDCDILIS